MTVLRRGITGFDATGRVDFAEFQRKVYAAAHRSGDRVGPAAAAGITPNFHRAEVRLRDRSFTVICNGTFPVVAFVEGPLAMDDLHFVDVAQFAEHLANFGFDIATAAELDRPIGADDLELLGDYEREEAEFWKATRIGQLVFNWWD